MTRSSSIWRRLNVLERTVLEQRPLTDVRTASDEQLETYLRSIGIAPDDESQLRRAAGANASLSANESIREP